MDWKRFIKFDIQKKFAFTLTETLVAIVIVGVIAALVVPITISKFTNRMFDTAYDAQIKTLERLFNNLGANDILSTSSSNLMTKYVKVVRSCSATGKDCFADKYSKFSGKTKSDYTPTYSGSCGILQNGMSLCLENVVTDANTKTNGNVATTTYKIRGIIDLNGKKKPNIFGQDLRIFEITPEGTKTYTNRITGDIITWDQDACTEVNAACCMDSAFFEAHKNACCGGGLRTDGCPTEPEPEPEPESGPCSDEAHWDSDCCPNKFFTEAQKEICLCQNAATWKETCCPTYHNETQENQCKCGLPTKFSDNKDFCCERYNTGNTAGMNPPQAAHFMCNGSTPPEDTTATVQIACYPHVAEARLPSGDGHADGRSKSGEVITYSQCGVNIKGNPPVGDKFYVNGLANIQVRLNIYDSNNMMTTQSTKKYLVGASFLYNIPALSSGNESFSESIYVGSGGITLDPDKCPQNHPISNGQIVQNSCAGNYIADPRTSTGGAIWSEVGGGTFNSCRFEYMSNSGSKTLTQTIQNCAVTCTYKNGVLQSCQ